MMIIGLTGGIGMGKTAVGNMFAELGAAVSSADEIVHELWRTEPALKRWAAENYPDVITEYGEVDRKKLSTHIFSNVLARKTLEAIIHPLVAAAELRFVEEAQQQGKEIVVIEIPLLFETEAYKRMDLTIAVSAPAQVQRERVLARGMDEATFQRVLESQLSDDERRERADLIIPTGQDLELTRQIVHDMWPQILQHSKKTEQDSHA